MKQYNKTVVVGMSGGVDSSVTAYLLKKKGFNVIGLFMNNWSSEVDDQCTAQQDFEDVKRVCNHLDIPYYSVDFSEEYKDRVFKYFLQEYRNGRTPNPDVLCNREIKFGPFLDYALDMGADYIATGHYARVKKENNIFYLLKGKDKNKDQSYFLNQLNQEQLSYTMFPLGDLQKDEIRKIALEKNIPTANKKDSTGICFIGERDFKEFLSSYIPANPGDIKDDNGKVVGKHDGLMYYTLGQRRGLNLGGIKGGSGKRWFVYKKDSKNNTLYVSQGEDDKLYSSGLILENIHWISKKPAKSSIRCKAKFRYRQKDQDVIIKFLNNKIQVDFDRKQRAITPGQWAVFYDGDICLGGGVIKSSY